MSFVGIVTRKEEVTGVELEAKIVTANKKKSTKIRRPVQVKANAVDDYTRCMMDNATAKNRILAMNDTSAIVADITASMMYSGENDTKTSYKIQNQGTPLLSDFLSDNGAIVGRPKLGQEDAVGTLEITTKRGDAVVISRIPIAVKQITALEVLEHKKLTIENIWNSYVRGGNAPYSNSENSGTKNVKTKLNLINQITLTDVADTPVTVEWTIEDSTISYAGGAYSTARIDASGNVIRPAFSDACTLYESMPTFMKLLREGSASSGRNIYYRIGGISLEATLKINTYEKKFTYDCATISKYLTNKEIIDKIAGSETVPGQIALIKPDLKLIKYAGDASLSIPDSAEEYILRAYRTGVYMALPEFGLTDGVDGVDIKNLLKAYDGISYYGPSTEVFGGDFFHDDDVNYDYLKINCAELKAQDPEYMKFACVAEVTVSGYSKDGLNPGGASEEVKKIAKITANFAS